MCVGREFFCRHPASLRRTAEFIAECMASNAIKNLQQYALKAVMTECLCFPVRGVFYRSVIFFCLLVLFSWQLPAYSELSVLDRCSAEAAEALCWQPQQPSCVCTVFITHLVKLFFSNYPKNVWSFILPFKVLCNCPQCNAHTYEQT